MKSSLGHILDTFWHWLALLPDSIVLHQTDLQEQVEVEVGAVVGDQVPEELLRVPPHKGHHILTKDAHNCICRVLRPTGVLNNIL